MSRRQLVAIIGLLGILVRARASDVPPTEPDRPVIPARVTETRTDGATAGHVTVPPAVGATQGSVSDATAKPDSGAGPSDVVAIRAETKERLGKLPSDDKSAAVKSLREVYEARLRLLDDWDKAVKERTSAENPETNPEKDASAWKTELERIRTVLAQSVKETESLVPPSFRNLPAQISDAHRAEMKDAIDAAQTEVNDWSSQLERVRADSSRKEGSALAAIRSRRDKAHQRVAALSARTPERENSVDDAKTPESSTLAREASENLELEARVETERLKGLEALLELETKRAEFAPMHLQVVEAHVQLAQRTLDMMKSSYRAMADRQERDLRQAAEQEQTRAEAVDDPLERYRAKRAAELLELQARVVTSENALATNPSPSLDEQRALADRADVDFTNIKHLLDDGRISHLDALRLTNDFRRLSVERARIVRKELALAANRLTNAENALSTVELELIYDARDDRFELENLLERLPRRLQARAIAIFEEQERKHFSLLNQRRDALEKIAQRAEQTHEQVLRRLRILDEHYGFIRANLFWVRDEDPVGLASATQAHRELTLLGRSVLRFVGELFDMSAWGRVSAEFLLATLGLAALPWPMIRAYRVLRPLRDPLGGPSARAV